MTDVPAPVLTDRDLADRYRISVEQVQIHCRTGAWPHIRMGRNYRFSVEQVEEIERLHTKTRAVTPAQTWGRKGRRAS